MPATAVALHQAVRAAFAMGSAGHLADHQLHRSLGREADHLAQEGGTRPFRRYFAKGSPLLGYRGGSRAGVARRNSIRPRITAEAASYTNSRGTTRFVPHQRMISGVFDVSTLRVHDASLMWVDPGPPLDLPRHLGTDSRRQFPKDKEGRGRGGGSPPPPFTPPPPPAPRSAPAAPAPPPGSAP